MKTFTAIAPAKINLFIDVKEKKPDQNFHEVENVMQTLTLHDKLTFLIPENEQDRKEIDSRRNRKINDFFGIKEACFSTCSNDNCDVSILIDDHTGQHLKIDAEDNLITKAILKSAKVANFSDNVQVEVWVDKNIPAKAGLGGGSSDAAATLVFTRLLFKLNDEQVFDGAKSLGADVPFFLEGGHAKMAGNGANLAENLPSLKNPIVLVKPSSGVSTKECYDRFDEMTENVPPKGEFHLKNDLEKPACALCPEIEEVLEFLKSECEPTNVLMSGSGSACFAICNSFEKARKVATLATRHSWWARSCSCVDLRSTLLDVN